MYIYCNYISCHDTIEEFMIDQEKKPKHTFPILFQCRVVCRGASHLDHERADHTINARKT